MTDEESNDFSRGHSLGQHGGHPDSSNESQMAGWQAARNEDIAASYTVSRPASQGIWASTPPPFLNTGTRSGSSDDTGTFFIFLFLAIAGLGGGKWGYDFAHKHYWEDFSVWLSATVEQ